jgi:hypothetical protein
MRVSHLRKFKQLRRHLNQTTMRLFWQPIPGAVLWRIIVRATAAQGTAGRTWLIANLVRFTTRTHWELGGSEKNIGDAWQISWLQKSYGFQKDLRLEGTQLGLNLPVDTLELEEPFRRLLGSQVSVKYSEAPWRGWKCSPSDKTSADGANIINILREEIGRDIPSWRG